MRFDEAVKQCSDDRTLSARRKSEPHIIFMVVGAYLVGPTPGKFDVCDYTATDWEVNKPITPLGEKFVSTTYVAFAYKEEDVRFAVRGLLDWVEQNPTKSCREKVVEFFGEIIIKGEPDY